MTIFNIQKGDSQTLTKKDFIIGSVIAVILLCSWIYMSSGMSLIATFVPGLVFAWGLFVFMYIRKIPLPNHNIFLPIYFFTLGWQFIHFSEEFTTNFKELFPLLYNGQPYTDNLFVTFNMGSYFVFIAAPVLAYYKGLKFLFLPTLFFIVYGAMGNAIAHTWWSLYLSKYFPGLYTASLYWVLGPVLLGIILKSKKATAIYIVILTVTLVLTLTLLMK
jgi:hypothetical protein